MTPEQIAACRAEGLSEFVVFLHEDKGDKFQIIFECWAEDDDHAAEQALNAYPNGEVLHTQAKP